MEVLFICTEEIIIKKRLSDAVGRFLGKGSGLDDCMAISVFIKLYLSVFGVSSHAENCTLR